MSAQGRFTWYDLMTTDTEGGKAGAARVTELGGNVVNGPMEVPGGGLIAQCVDPQGAFFAIHSTAS